MCIAVCMCARMYAYSSVSPPSHATVANACKTNEHVSVGVCILECVRVRLVPLCVQVCVLVCLCCVSVCMLERVLICLRVCVLVCVHMAACVCICVYMAALRCLVLSL